MRSMSGSGICLLAMVLLVAGCQSTGLNMKRSLNNTAHGYSVVADPLGQKTSKVERFEVRPGDCSSNADWSDCSSDRERSELSNSDNAGFGKEWYSWEMLVPDDFENVYPTKVALGQFHNKGSTTPSFMFQNGYGGLTFDMQVSRQPEDQILLIDEEDFRGRWHRITVEANWSKGDDGYVNVWVNGEQLVEYNGSTVRQKSRGIYFKYGLYRSFLSRFKRYYNKSSVPAQTVYYANMRRGSSRAEVEMKQK